VVERTIQARATGTNQFLDLDTGTLLTPPDEISGVLAATQPGEDENRFWQALDIPGDSARFRYIAWLRESGADLMFAGNGKIIGFDGLFPIVHGEGSANWDNWDGLSPDQAGEAVNVVDWGRRSTDASRRGLPAPPAPKSGGIVHSAVQLDSQSGDGPIVNRLTRDQSVLWFFKTREGATGVLQIVEFIVNPEAVKIRYKLTESTPGSPLSERELGRESFVGRFEAASMISGTTERDAAMAKLARDAADAGEVELVKSALREIRGVTEHDQTAFDSARRLARLGLRKQAVEIAKTINGNTMRDLALAELAR
jgi:hypothetical protein